MSRHPLDHQTAQMAPRPRQFRPETSDQPSAATRDLLRRARTKGAGRMVHFPRTARSEGRD